jgi:hypothetical protein
MADGAAGYQRKSLEDTMLAHADRMLFEAVFNSFYGELTFVFKSGKIVLVRKQETILPTNERLGGGEAISEGTRDGSHDRHSPFDL